MHQPGTPRHGSLNASRRRNDLRTRKAVAGMDDAMNPITLVVAVLIVAVALRLTSRRR
jgi:hypothetical protein